MDKLRNIHPGEILKLDFMDQLDLSVSELSDRCRIPELELSAIISGQRNITAVPAKKLGNCFGTTARFWLNLQDHYDMVEEQEKAGR